MLLTLLSKLTPTGRPAASSVVRPAPAPWIETPAPTRSVSVSVYVARPEHDHVARLGGADGGPQAGGRRAAHGDRRIGHDRKPLEQRPRRQRAARVARPTAKVYVTPSVTGAVRRSDVTPAPT